MTYTPSWWPQKKVETCRSYLCIWTSAVGWKSSYLYMYIARKMYNTEFITAQQAELIYRYSLCIHDPVQNASKLQDLHQLVSKFCVIDYEARLKFLNRHLQGGAWLRSRPHAHANQCESLVLSPWVHEHSKWWVLVCGKSHINPCSAVTWCWDGCVICYECSWDCRVHFFAWAINSHWSFMHILTPVVEISSVHNAVHLETIFGDNNNDNEGG